MKSLIVLADSLNVLLQMPARHMDQAGGAGSFHMPGDAAGKEQGWLRLKKS